MLIYQRVYDIWLVVWNMNGLWISIQLGMSSSQLTFTPSLFRGIGTTNQTRLKIVTDHYKTLALKLKFMNFCFVPSKSLGSWVHNFSLPLRFQHPMAEDLWLPPGEMPLVHAGQTCFACKVFKRMLWGIVDSRKWLSRTKISLTNGYPGYPLVNGYITLGKLPFVWIDS